MSRTQWLHERYERHKRDLEAHLRRGPFTASLLNENWTRAEMQRISERIVELGGDAPDPVAIADEVHGLETAAADRFEALDSLAELHREQQGAGLDAAHAGDDDRDGRRRELEQRWDTLAAQVTAAYAAGEPGAETGAPPTEAERELDRVTIQLMTGIYEPAPQAAQQPDAAPAAAPGPVSPAAALQDAESNYWAVKDDPAADAGALVEAAEQLEAARDRILEAEAETDGPEAEP